MFLKLVSSLRHVLTGTTHGIVLASGTHVTGRTSFSLTTRHCVVVHFVGNSRAAWVVSFNLQIKAIVKFVFYLNKSNNQLLIQYLLLYLHMKLIRGINSKKKFSPMIKSTDHK